MDFCDPPMKRRRVSCTHRVNHSESNKDPTLLSPNEANTSFCPADISNAEVVVEQGDTFNDGKENSKEGSQIVIEESNLIAGEDSSIGMSTESKMDATKESASQVTNEDNTPPEILGTCCCETVGSHSRKKLLVPDVNGLLVDIVADPDEEGDTFNDEKENSKEGSQIVMKESNLTADEDSSISMSSESKMDATKGSASLVMKEDNSPQEILGTGDSRWRKKLLVLDVNGLLVDIVADPDEAYKPDTIIGSKAVFKRPYCDEFLKFCFERFNVGVWTSRTRRNIERVLDFLIKDTSHQLLFCWDQSHCTETGFNTIENSEKPLVLKELKRLWEKQDPKLPWDKGVYDESNTFLLDDSPYKALRNPPYTAIFPFTYSYRNTQDNGLGPEGDLRNYLERLAASDNVQNFIEQNPFGQQPITHISKSWKFYMKVISGTSSEPEADAATSLAAKCVLEEKAKSGPSRSRKKLIIIDASGLLIDMAAFPREGYKADTIQGSKSVFKRPYCDEFLQFCFEKFNVGVWTSTTRRNIERVLDFLMRDIPHKLLFCWDQSYCTDTGFRTVENIHKPLILKELRRLWEKKDPNLPWDRGDYDESNTLLIEYSAYKALLNPPHTAIFPYPYRYWHTEDNFLGPDGDLRVYLERLAAADSVQKFVEQNPFGQRPITKKNLSWGFYQKVICAFSSKPEADVNTSANGQCSNSSEREADTTAASVTQTLSEPEAHANGSLDGPPCNNSSEPEANATTAPVTISEPQANTITAPVGQTISGPEADTITVSVAETILEPEADSIPASVTQTHSEPEADPITASIALTISDPEAGTTTALVAQNSPETEPDTTTDLAAR